MKIVADANIISLAAYFEPLGELQLIPGREISNAHLQDADVLLVRSITEVDEELLANSSLSFVATATSGTNHVDLDYLRRRGIGFADAKGCNANAVVDYCFAALAVAVQKRGDFLPGTTVGIIGAGFVGTLFAKKLVALGFDVRCCDPFLAQGAEESSYYSLQEALACSIVSLHVPLTSSGDYPTLNMISTNELEQLQSGAVLINSCRGGIINEEALIGFLSEREDVFSISDVWVGEPEIDAALASLVSVATPHIAGYSIEAKTAATESIWRSCCKYLGVNNNVTELAIRSGLMHEFIHDSDSSQHWDILRDLLPLEKLSLRLKASLRRDDAAAQFDGFRQEFASRREFIAYEIRSDLVAAESRAALQALGFKLR